MCLKASGSNSSAGLCRATKADDHWATRQAQLTVDLARFHRALCRQGRMKNSSHLSVVDKLGPYEILAPIGKGGMGEDPRLNHDVATNLSAAQFSDRF